MISVVITEEQDGVAPQPWTVAEKIEIDVAGKYRPRCSRRLRAAMIRVHLGRTGLLI
jgi:hypothetical protein